ncbi:hypothetical protein ILYODFUR_037261 [Ilyodon furcidens]|uniref:Secreted protein n=1 Tax=Ilyodon furcidens TaxID=33524 RepID=A0ABV0VLU0_9TELE
MYIFFLRKLNIYFNNIVLLSVSLCILCVFMFFTVLWSRATILWSHSVKRNFSTSESPLSGFFHHHSSIQASPNSWRAEPRHSAGYSAESVGGGNVLARW